MAINYHTEDFLKIVLENTGGKGVDVVFDEGFSLVNPLSVRKQIEGQIAWALSDALWQEITIKDGRVEQSNFHDYPPLRINEMPRVEVYIVSSTEKPTGVGEPGTPVVAPAVANALAAATGKRLRSLPLTLA